jgi:hypothetical protein
VIDATGSLFLDTGGPTLVNAGLIEATGSGALTIAGTTIDGSSGGTISAATGARVLLDGASLAGGTLTSAGAGVIKTIGGTDVLDGTGSAVANTAAVAVGDGTSLTIQGLIVNSGQIALRSTGDTTTLAIGSAEATLFGGGTVSLDDQAMNQITGSGLLANLDNTISGAGTIGGGTLTLANGGVIEGQFTTGLVVDTGASTVTNTGTIEVVDGGAVSVESALDNTGTVLVTNGTLTLAGAVTGAGVAQIKGGVLDAAGSFDENVAFTGGTGVLKLADSQGYTSGQISGFSTTGGMSLDLQDIGFTSGITTATFSGTSTSGVLTVTNGTQTAAINLTGDYLASTFTTSADTSGGTTVVDPTGPAVVQRFVEATARMAPTAAATATRAGEARDALAPILARPGVAFA